MFEEVWRFFENMNELVYVSDVDSHELLYMNQKALKLYGLQSVAQIKGKKCYETLQNASVPCAFCNSRELRQGYFREWRYYSPVLDKYLMVKDTVEEVHGRRVRIELAIDISAENEQKNIVRDYQNLETLINEALRLALQASNPERSLEIALEYLGKALEGERAYIFEKNDDGGDDNTYEWVASGVTPEKENLQNLPPEVCEEWYRIFNEDKCVVLEDIEIIREKNLLQYQLLKRQHISSIVVVPLYHDGEAVGFYGVDNPPVRSLNYISNMLQIMGHFMESLLKMRNLVRNLQKMSFSDQLTRFQNRYALKELVGRIKEDQKIGTVYGDITGLKRVNDEEGHKAGDRLIVAACACMRAGFAEEELFRVGGDELLAVCLDIEEEEFKTKLNKIRAAMKQSSVVMAVGAVWKQDARQGIKRITEEAEALMYEEKAAQHAAARRNQTDSGSRNPNGTGVRSAAAKRGRKKKS